MNLPIAILAGGLATRLRPLSDDTPKALVDVSGKPFIFHQLEMLSAGGFRDVFVCVGHLGYLIEEAVGDGSRWGLHIHCLHDGPQLLGTGGALLRALRYLGDAFFVQYGDSYLPCDYRSIARAFERSSTLGLMTVYLNDNRWDASNVLFENGRIVCYDKRHPTPGMRHIDYGLGALRAAAFDPYDPGAPLDLADVYRDLAARRELTGCEVPERFYEIGSVSGLAALRSHLDPINPQRRMRDDEPERSSRQDLR